MKMSLESSAAARLLVLLEAVSAVYRSAFSRLERYFARLTAIRTRRVVHWSVCVHLLTSILLQGFSPSLASFAKSRIPNDASKAYYIAALLLFKSMHF